MESQLAEAMEEEVVPQAGREVAEEWREESMAEVDSGFQGMEGLLDYYTEVEQVGEEFVFHIEHPTAPLHERGGHIEPMYAEATTMGWTRDGFYEALKDCNEWVKQKRFMRTAAYTIRREYR